MWKKKTENESQSEKLAMRRLLEASSSDQPRTEPPPFFAARVRALAEQSGSAGPHPIGAAAAQALPLLSLAVLCIGAWTAYETFDAREEARAALSRALSDPQRLDEAMVIAMLADANRGGRE
jgi:hypothetical protein